MKFYGQNDAVTVKENFQKHSSWLRSERKNQNNEGFPSPIRAIKKQIWVYVLEDTVLNASQKVISLDYGKQSFEAVPIDNEHSTTIEPNARKNNAPSKPLTQSEEPSCHSPDVDYELP